jgi:para-aminobenzoate synthetase
VIDQANLFSWMQTRIDSYGLGVESICAHEIDDLSNPINVPFEFLVGFVGYFGYEMGKETLPIKQGTASATPDASFVFLDRVIVVDHLDGCYWLVELSKGGERDGWISRTRERIRELRTNGLDQSKPACGNESRADQPSCVDSNIPPILVAKLRHPRSAYLDNIEACLSKIVDGESYEICLTTQITVDSTEEYDFNAKSFSIYKHLRTRNPAPYGAYLRFTPELSIASSSPERFIKIDRDTTVTMKPIKGTMPRGATVEADEVLKEKLANSIKDRSENLMVYTPLILVQIVDLIRNDLNLVCIPDTVHVPHLFAIESYATVHQLVSTVSGKLSPSLSPMDAVFNTFPPGSMTGAPKLRSVEILAELEQGKRGPYSGGLGWLCVTGRTAEFSVVIRTCVFDGSGVSVGCGGAIVALSCAEEEVEEMMLKGNSTVPSVGAGVGGVVVFEEEN